MWSLLQCSRMEAPTQKRVLRNLAELGCEKAEAVFKISLARRNSAFSRSRHLISACSSRVSPGRCPACTNDCSYQLSRDSTATANLGAISLTALHCEHEPSWLKRSLTIRTARSLKPCEYLLDIFPILSKTDRNNTQDSSNSPTASKPTPPKNFRAQIDMRHHGVQMGGQCAKLRVGRARTGVSGAAGRLGRLNRLEWLGSQVRAVE